MMTLEKGSFEFQKNANDTGIQTFRFYKRGVNPEGKNVYIYTRTKDGVLWAVEVLIPNVKKAGTYPLPNNKTITYTEDFEEYPGASLFGRTAWFFRNITAAERKFESLVNPTANVANSNPIIPETPKPVKAPVQFVIPVGEFSTKELAQQNNVDYPIAFLFLKEQEQNGLIKRTRTERRAAKGKETQLFAKVNC